MHYGWIWCIMHYPTACCWCIMHYPMLLYGWIWCIMHVPMSDGMLLYGWIWCIMHYPMLLYGWIWCIMHYPMLLYGWIWCIMHYPIFYVPWGLIGRYRPGRFRLYGTRFLAQWVVDQCNMKCGWGHISGSAFLPVLLRCLGMKIGKGVTLTLDKPYTAWDIVAFEDGASNCHGHLYPISYTQEAM
eukprot:gene4436-14505_t